MVFREIKRVMILGLILTGCSGQKPEKTVLFTASLSGYLEACTCPGTPVGGLNTVAHLIKAFRHQHPGVLLVDAGLFTSDTLDTLNAFYTARAMELVDYDLICPAPRDTQPGYSGLFQHLPLLSSQKPWVMIDGVVFASPDCARLPDAMYTVVLSQNDPREDSSCALRLGPDVIINARPGPESLWVNNTLIVHAVPRGMALGVLKLKPKGPEVSFIPVQKTTPSDQDVDFVLQAYTEAFRQHLVSTGPELSFKGPGYCRFCHQEEYAAWRSSSHAKAFETLLHGDKTDITNPWCLSCHTTGYGKGGFKDDEQTPHLAGVSCESCHPGADCPDHPPKRGDLRECLVCHTPEQSPDFDTNTYWQEIRH